MTKTFGDLIAKANIHNSTAKCPPHRTVPEHDQRISTRHRELIRIDVGIRSRQPATLSAEQADRPGESSAVIAPYKHVRHLEPNNRQFCDSFSTLFQDCCLRTQRRTNMKTRYLLLGRGVLAKACDALVDVHPKLGLFRPQNASTQAMKHR